MNDSKRLDWLEAEIRQHGTVNFERYGKDWMRLFSVSSQHTKQKPDIRDLIDHAIELSKDGGINA